MNPFDGLTNRQHTLVKLAIDFMKVASRDTPERAEYEELSLLLEQAVDRNE